MQKINVKIQLELIFLLLCLPALLMAQNGLSLVQVVPDNSTAASSSIHTVTFTTTNPIPADGRIVIIYPSGFDVSNVSIASSTTIDGSLTVTTSGNTITVIRSGGTATVGSVNETVKLANVKNAPGAGTYSVIVQTRTIGAALIDSGTFGFFEVRPDDINHFSISHITTPQIAGTSFSVTITAQDKYNNAVVTYGESASLEDLTSSVSPTQLSFVNGEWSGDVVITKSKTGNYLTIIGSGKSSNSNQFNITPAAISNFVIDPIASPVIAGSQQSITITARDQYGNTATDFGGTANITDDTGTLVPAVSGAFTNGTRIENITITRAHSDVAISVNDGSNHNGSSNLFNIIHASINSFTIANISDQAAGTPFPVTVTAIDIYGNTITSFDGSGNTVNITHNGTGVIIPTLSGEFIKGIWTGNLTITQTQTGDRIIITRTGGGVTAQSNQFNVSASSVDHFVISAIGNNQTAGSSFPVTITAKDAAGNTITNFSGSANLFDETGTNTPSQFSFTNGIWSGNVIITSSRQQNTLTVSSLGKSNTSNEFNVGASVVNGFVIEQISTPQVVGTAFNVDIKAVDQFGNTANYNGNVTLSDDTGTLIPGTSGLFGNGLLTQSVTIIKTASDVKITASDGSTNYGASNYFNVISGPVHHFVVNVSGNQIAKDPFTIQVQAEDEYNNIATGFTGTVDLTDITNAVRPAKSSSFTAGFWTGNVTIDQKVNNDVITVVRTGGSETGSSRFFNLIEAPGIRILESITSQHNVTASQNEDWNIKFAVTNVSANYATLDSVRLKFSLYGQQQNDYTVVLPTEFIKSQSNRIAGNATDTLLLNVSKSGAGAGAVFVHGNVYCLDSNTGRTVIATGETAITVQDSAKLDIFKLEVSQKEITQGQDSVWTIMAILQNSGEARILLDSAAVTNALDFSIGNDWVIARPTAFNGGGWDISGGEVDTLLFKITHTGSSIIGVCEIQAEFTGKEINTGRVLNENTSDHGSVSVTIEEKAVLQIISVKSMALNDLKVNTKQDFYMRIKVRNSGSDSAYDLRVSLQTNGYSIFPQSANGSIAELQGGEIDSVDILIRASSSSTAAERFIAQAQGYAENTGRFFQSAASALDYINIIIQDPAKIFIPNLVLSASEVVAGQVDPWTIKTVVRNIGQADVLLEPLNDDISFWSSNLRQSDYIVAAPSQLAGGGLILHAGGRDTLIYRITTTGRLGGTIKAKAAVHGIDQNSGATRDTTGESQFSVQAETDFRIISTTIKTLNRTDAGNGIVNTGQSFIVKVVLENGLGETIRNVRVRLQTSGESSILQSPVLITRILPSKVDSVFFTVTAGSAENLQGDTFIAEILSGQLENSGSSAPVGSPIDNIASVVVQTKAKIGMELKLSNSSGQYSVNQSFTLTARLTNEGTGKIDDSGKLTITLPQNYVLESGSEATGTITDDAPIVWKIKSPAVAHSQPRKIEVNFDNVPIEINTGQAAETAATSAEIDVQTISTLLNSDVSIATPVGAMDGTVSTDQYFVIKAKIQWRNVQRIEAHITLPAGYSTSDNVVKSVISQEIYWQIKAPSTPANLRLIKIDLNGYDALQPENEVTGLQSQLAVITESKADLSLSLTTSDNSVSLGQEFIIYASVSNSGQADTLGRTRVTLETLPAGYTTRESYGKTLVRGGCSWIIKAPTSPTREAVNIVGNISTIPFDENTNTEGYVSRGTDKTALTTVGAWLAIQAVAVPDTLSGVVLPGQENVWLGAMLFSNRGEAGANSIVINSIKFAVENGSNVSIKPASVLKSIRLVSLLRSGDYYVPNTALVYGSVGLTAFQGNGPIIIPITNQLRIAAGDTGAVAVVGTIADVDTVGQFVLTILNQNSIDAKDEHSPLVDVTVKDVTGKDFTRFNTYKKQILSNRIADDSKPYFVNCPNPFGQSGKKETVFVYSLKEMMDVTITIVTLTGEKVWSKTFNSGAPETRAGVHSLGTNMISWNGKNEAGHAVINGVYIAFLETGDGKKVSTKIAVMR